MLGTLNVRCSIVKLWSGWRGSNSRSPGPGPGAFPLGYNPMLRGHEHFPRREGNGGEPPPSQNPVMVGSPPSIIRFYLS